MSVAEQLTQCEIERIISRLRSGMIMNSNILFILLGWTIATVILTVVGALTEVDMLASKQCSGYLCASPTQDSP